MIVTAGTTERHSHERFADRRNLFVDDIHAELFFVPLAEHFRSEHQKAGCHQIPFPLIRRGMIEQVAGNLFDDKIVERPILVESVDHIISITPGIVEGGVEVAAIRVGITCHIEPVSSPVLAELLRVEQAIDVFGNLLRVIAIGIFLDVFRRGR